jgi:hypothetical protein
MMDTVSETRYIGRTLKRMRSMERVERRIRPKRGSDISTGERDFSVFVEFEYDRFETGKIKLFGEELKQLLKGHTFHVNSRGFWVRRRFESDLTDD